MSFCWAVIVEVRRLHPLVVGIGDRLRRLGLGLDGLPREEHVRPAVGGQEVALGGRRIVLRTAARRLGPDPGAHALDRSAP
jgi:hypothetical protein